jgi:RNA recognition motif-containing protein
MCMTLNALSKLTFLCVLDAETASSAVRNLNGYELGGRQLRVDYADMDPAIEAQRQRERGHDVRIMILSISSFMI